MEVEMRYLFALLLVAGCASGPEYSSDWNACITPGYVTGDLIRNVDTGQIGKVNKVYGSSTRCTHKDRPNLADVAWQ
jgi:hypothetical protein